MIDLQVNGYGGVDFNQDTLTAEGLHLACEALRRDGVDSVLATIITEALPLMSLRIARLVELRANDPLACEVIVGLHVEGPFISPQPGYVGAHPADAVCPANPDDMQRLLDAGQGLVRLVTLAPEHDAGFATIRRLAHAGVLVSAGHCDPSREVLKGACDAGLSMFTHLGNGCPSMLPRHDNIIQRALSLADRLTLCFIADGVHVPYFALRNYLETAGFDRCIVVSDAIAPAGLGPGRFTLSRLELEIGDDLVARSSDGSHLVGSAMGLKLVAQRLREHLNYGGAVVHQLTSGNASALI